MTTTKTYGTRGKAAPHNATVYSSYLRGLGIDQNDIQSLKQRGLTDEQIALAGYASKPYNKSANAVKAVVNLQSEFNLEGIPGFYVDEETGHWTALGISGIMIPVRDFDGNISSIIIRNAKPREGKDGKVGNKYVSFSSAGKTKGSKLFQTIHCPAITGPAKEKAGVAIRVTEGVLKADVTTAIGDLYCIGLQGLRVSDDFEVILNELEVSEVRICLDQGEDENTDIIKARCELIQRVRKFGADVVIEIWDAKFGKGIDDVLSAGLADKIHKATEKEIDDFLEMANIKNPENGEWCYVISIERFVNINNFQQLKKSQFADKFCMETVDNVNKMIAAGFKQVDSLSFLPAAEKYIREGKLECLNTWTDPKITPIEGDIAPFLNHLEYIFPDEHQRNLLLDYMAYQVQHPGKKVLWSVVIKGNQGVGKSYFASVMRFVLGAENVSSPSNEMIHEPYTEWQKSTQLVIIEELMAKGRIDLMNKLKPMITQEITSVREMHKPSYVQPNRFNFMMFTNYDDALVLEKDDRRYCILKTIAKLLGVEYYEMLWSWTKEPSSIQAILYFLNKRILSDFKPTGAAPMTNAKRDLINISRSGLEEWVQVCIEDEAHPFNLGIVVIRHLKDKKICPAGYEKFSDFKWSEALSKAGAIKYEHRITMTDGSKCHVWLTADNREFLAKQSPDVIRGMYEKNNIRNEPGGNPLEDIAPL